MKEALPRKYLHISWKFSTNKEQSRLGFYQILKQRASDKNYWFLHKKVLKVSALFDGDGFSPLPIISGNARFMMMEFLPDAKLKVETQNQKNDITSMVGKL